MLKSRLQHPGILRSISAAGHGAQILITDGHYPASTKVRSGVERIYLNITPGLLSVTDLLQVLTDTIEIEAVTVMAPPEGPMPSIFSEFQEIIPDTAEFNKLDRFGFYDRCVDNDDLCLVLVSTDTRQYANILLTIGVCK